MRADAVRTISALRAAVFAAGLSAALAVVITPALPGSLEQGAQIGTTQLTSSRAAAAVLVSLLCGGALALYLYLFQPRGLGGKRRLALLATAVVVSLAASRLFLSITLPDHHRLYLPYVLPVGAAPMLIATLLDEG